MRPQAPKKGCYHRLSWGMVASPTIKDGTQNKDDDVGQNFHITTNFLTAKVVKKKPHTIKGGLV